jgi:hypothetical protein
MTPFIEPLADGHVWLRVAKASWADPLDPTYAKDHGGRWNPPRSHATLYLNEDLATARAQIPRMLEGYPATPEDLDDEFVLVGATLPARQMVADAVSDQGLEALGLPASYPAHANGRPVRRATCQPVGEQVAAMGLRGIRARSAATRDGSGRELAWFPARTTSRATQAGSAIPFHAWWDADPGIGSG